MTAAGENAEPPWKRMQTQEEQSRSSPPLPPPAQPRDLGATSGLGIVHPHLEVPGPFPEMPTGIWEVRTDHIISTPFVILNEYLTRPPFPYLGRAGPGQSDH